MAQECSTAELRRLALLHQGMTPESWMMDWAATEIERLRKVKDCADVVCAAAGAEGLIYSRDQCVVDLLDALYEADQK